MLDISILWAVIWRPAASSRPGPPDAVFTHQLGYTSQIVGCLVSSPRLSRHPHRQMVSKCSPLHSLHYILLIPQIDKIKAEKSCTQYRPIQSIWYLAQPQPIILQWTVKVYLFLDTRFYIYQFQETGEEFPGSQRWKINKNVKWETIVKLNSSPAPYLAAEMSNWPRCRPTATATAEQRFGLIFCSFSFKF